MIRRPSNVVRNNGQNSLGSQVCYLFQDDWNLAESGNHDLANFEKLVEYQFGNLNKWWFSRMKLRRSKEGLVKDVTSKVRVWSVNQWQACKCMKLAPQIMGCKRHLCTCSHQEYPLDSRVVSECKSPFVSVDAKIGRHPCAWHTWLPGL
jgi:hypothetical protein